MSPIKLDVTENVESMLRAFLEAQDEPLWGYLLRQRTGLGSSTVHQILARLERAGWVLRTDEDSVSGGRERVTYRLNPNELEQIRYQCAAASLSRSRTKVAVARGRLRKI